MSRQQLFLLNRRFYGNSRVCMLQIMQSAAQPATYRQSTSCDIFQTGYTVAGRYTERNIWRPQESRPETTVSSLLALTPFLHSRSSPEEGKESASPFAPLTRGWCDALKTSELIGDLRHHRFDLSNTLLNESIQRCLNPALPGQQRG